MLAISSCVTRYYVFDASEERVEALELGDDVLDGGPVQVVPDEDGADELDEVGVAFQPAAVLLRDQFMVLGHPRVELHPVRVVEQELPRQQLVEQTPETPDVTRTRCAEAAPPVEVLVVLARVQRQVQHLGRLDVLRASVAQVDLFVLVQEYSSS
jgi:hypothetical protein